MAQNTTRPYHHIGFALACLFSAFISSVIAQDLSVEPLPEAAKGDPDDNWTAQDSAVDESGESAQGVAPGFVYEDDRYENLNYNSNSAGSADIAEIEAGIDKDFIYIDIGFAEPWSSSRSQKNTVGIEIDTDHPDEANRGDYFVYFELKNELDDNEKWKDVKDNGGFKISRDQNNSVGGPNPLSSDYPFEGEGYEDGRNEDKDKVFGRIMDDGRVEVAIKRDQVGSKDEPFTSLRVWTRQDEKFGDDGKELHLNDTLPEMAIDGYDSYPGALIDEWLLLEDVDDNDVDLKLEQVADNPNARQGEPVIFTITLSHIFGTKTAEDVEVKIKLDKDLDFVSGTPSEGDFEGDDKWKLDEVEAGQSYTLELIAMVKDDADTCDELDAEAEIDKIKKADDINDANNEVETIIKPGAYDGTIEFVSNLAGDPLGPVSPGDEFFIKVEDVDLNTRDNREDSVFITVFSEGSDGRRFDSTIVRLTETGDDTSVFTGSVQSEVAEDPNRFDFDLQMRTDDRVIANYQDRLTEECVENLIREDELSFDPPQLILDQSVDPTLARPGEELTYRVGFRNIGGAAVTNLRIQESIPAFTAYSSGSMRVGLAADDYDSAFVLTDVDDGVEGTVNGADVSGEFVDGVVLFTISSVAAEDGTQDEGADEGAVFFKVTIE